MEISLLSKHGIAENSILSVRAGAIKRQAPIESGRPFRFPKLGMDENPVRLAILQQIGSAYLVLKPKENRYQVTFDTGGSCEVEVRASTGDAEEQKAGETTGNENSSTAKEAKDYLEQHQLLQFVQGVLQAVIKEKPQNPFTYMARHFMSGYESENHKKSKAPAAEETQSPAGAEAAPPPQDASPPAAPVGVAKGEVAEVVPTEEEGPLKATAPLQAQASPAPEVQNPLFDPEVLRMQVQDTLMKATQEGTLSETLKVVRPLGASKAAHAPEARQPEQPRVHFDNSLQEEQNDDLRMRMKETLLGATEDGSLLQAMQTVLTDQKAETVADKPMSTDDLIRQVQETFSKAEREGTLAAAIERAVARDEGEGEDIKDGCAKAADSPGLACNDVTERQVTQEGTKEVVQEQPVAVDDLRAKAAAALNEAMRTGSLGSVLEAVTAECPNGNGVDLLKDPPDPQIDDLRVRMKDTLLQATNTGSLQTAIEKALHDTKEAELHEKAAAAPADAAGAATLEETPLKEA